MLCFDYYLLPNGTFSDTDREVSSKKEMIKYQAVEIAYRLAKRMSGHIFRYCKISMIV